MIEAFETLLPVLSDLELEELTAAVDRVVDAQRDVALLTAELAGEVSLLQHAHTP